MLSSYFQVYDFRFEKYSDDFIKELCKFSSLSKEITISYDGSKKGRELYEKAKKLLPEAFLKVHDYSILPSPIAHYLSRKYKLSFQFTASHLAKEMYGLKVHYKGFPITKKVVKEIEKKKVKKVSGKLIKGDLDFFSNKFLQFVNRLRKKELFVEREKVYLVGPKKTLKIYKDLLKDFLKVKIIDGDYFTFSICKEEPYFVFDYDCDRMKVIFGREFYSFEVFYLSREFLRKIGIKKVVVDSLFPFYYEKLLKKEFEIYRSKVGRVNVIKRGREKNADFIVEVSNHYYFNFFSFSSFPLPIVFAFLKNKDKIYELQRKMRYTIKRKKVKNVEKYLKKFADKYKARKYYDCYLAKNKKNGKVEILKIRRSNTEKSTIVIAREIFQS